MNPKFSVANVAHFKGTVRKEGGEGTHIQTPLKAYKGIIYTKDDQVSNWRLCTTHAGNKGWKKAWNASKFSSERMLCQHIDRIVVQLPDETREKLERTNQMESCPVCTARYYPAYQYHGRCPVCDH